MTAGVARGLGCLGCLGCLGYQMAEAQSILAMAEPRARTNAALHHAISSQASGSRLCPHASATKDSAVIRTARLCESRQGGAKACMAQPCDVASAGPTRITTAGGMRRDAWASALAREE
ncbi:hypothetical protein L209DRAFT_743642 [Thermothelomyces heterothallicus CBS 203.75]